MNSVIAVDPAIIEQLSQEPEELYWWVFVDAPSSSFMDRPTMAVYRSEAEAVLRATTRGLRVAGTVNGTLDQAICVARQFECRAVLLRAYRNGEWVVLREWPVE